MSMSLGHSLMAIKMEDILSLNSLSSILNPKESFYKHDTFKMCIKTPALLLKHKTIEQA
jgi:hypothetical protein